MGTTNLENNLVSTLLNRLNDSLNARGGNVTDLALDLINRSHNEKVANEANWPGLQKSVELTLSNNSATLPTDISRIIRVESDSNSDNKPEEYYFNEGELTRGYKISSSYDKATGTIETISFFQAPTNVVKLVYFPTLPAFTGTGVEYTYFPGNLVLAGAKVLHSEDGGIFTIDTDRLIRSYQDMLSKTKSRYLYQNAPMRKQVNNVYGREVVIQDLSLDGSAKISSRNYNDNSRDVDSGYGY